MRASTATRSAPNSGRSFALSTASTPRAATPATPTSCSSASMSTTTRPAAEDLCRGLCSCILRGERWTASGLGHRGSAFQKCYDCGARLQLRFWTCTNGECRGKGKKLKSLQKISAGFERDE